jgi:hypothetical protein
VFVELQCDQFEVPVEGEAIVRLADGRPHSIDIGDAWVTVWDEEGDASIEVISKEDKCVDEALMLARVWLHRFGAVEEASLIDAAVERFEPAVGYLAGRRQVFRAFHDGFSGEAGVSDNDPTLAACYRAGRTAGQLNRDARTAKPFPDLGCAPFDTDTARSAFARALEVR